MKKSDLKSGMLVRLRNREIRILIDDYLIHKEERPICTKKYTDDLLFNDSREEDFAQYDIMGATKVLGGYLLTPSCWHEQVYHNYLNWERKCLGDKTNVDEGIPKAQVVFDAPKGERIEAQHGKKLLLDWLRSGHRIFRASDPDGQLAVALSSLLSELEDSDEGKGLGEVPLIDLVQEVLNRLSCLDYQYYPEEKAMANAIVLGLMKMDAVMYGSRSNQ